MIRFPTLVMIFSLLGVMLPLAAAAPPATRPTTAIEPAGCVTHECHANIKSFPVVHGPVDIDTCDACHILADATLHTFELRAGGEELCTYCHAFSVKGMPVVHEPVTRGECLGCHSPHGGVSRAMMREASILETCERCHESVIRHQAFVHAPAEQGACDACHPPHAAMFPKLLDVVGTDLCLTCHADFEANMAAAPHQHQAMKDGCEKCHAPHGGPAPMSLRQSPPRLCLDCHDALDRAISNATFAHTAVNKERSCLLCHTPHFSTIAGLQPQPTIDSCLTCHTKDVTTTEGRVVAAVPELSDPNMHKHGRIRDGECAGCHAVHGGSREALLTNEFSRYVYERFSISEFALCFDCHDARLILEERTDAFTSFRNGDVNLHFQHANRDQRDRNCRVCHVIHAAPNDRLIRPMLAYGAWQLPIRFEQTATGGSCVAGCHRKLAYDRETPVPRPATAPTTSPADFPRDVLRVAALARAQHREDRFIHWSTVDRAGGSVSVPTGDRPAVLVVVGSEKSLEPMLQQLHAATLDCGAYVVVVAAGADAETVAGAVERAAPASWPIVVDETLEVARELGVRGWPVVLVLRPDGKEVARLAGEEKVLALKLPPYLRLAAGLAEPADVERQLSTRRSPLESEKAADRAVKAAEMLLRQNQPAQALQLLDAALATTPDARDLVLLRISALRRLGRADEALKQLSALPRGALPPSDEAALRAEAAIAAARWYEARSLLVRALERDPNHPRLHFLMGVICENAREWSKAAEHYRAAATQRSE